MRRTVPLATFVAGLTLLGASLSGMAGLDRSLAGSAATEREAQTELVRYERGSYCPWRERQRAVREQV
jgi:hypothetical protein